MACDKLCNFGKHPLAWGLGACPKRFRVREILKLPAVFVLLSHKRTPANDKKIRNTDIYFNQFQYNYNIGFLLLPPLKRSPSLKDGGICTPKLSQINKNLQVLNRADNIRPYGASKDIAKNSKHLQALNRVEQSPPLQKNKHRKGREQLPAFPHQSIISISGLTVFKYCITRSS